MNVIGTFEVAVHAALAAFAAFAPFVVALKAHEFDAEFPMGPTREMKTGRGGQRQRISPTGQHDHLKNTAGVIGRPSYYPAMCIAIIGTHVPGTRLD